MDIRALTPDDAEALLPLMQGLAAHHGDMAQATSASLARDLHHVFVMPEARRCGVARALIAAAEIDATKRGCSDIVIGANRGNDGARDAYRALGYDWSEPTSWRFRKQL